MHGNEMMGTTSGRPFGHLRMTQKEIEESTQIAMKHNTFLPLKKELDKERAAPTVDREEIERRMQKAKGVMNFGPADGICWNCKKQIFEVLSGESAITGCPFCHRTYCD